MENTFYCSLILSTFLKTRVFSNYKSGDRERKSIMIVWIGSQRLPHSQVTHSQPFVQHLGSLSQGYQFGVQQQFGHIVPSLLQLTQSHSVMGVFGQELLSVTEPSVSVSGGESRFISLLARLMVKYIGITIKINALKTDEDIVIEMEEKDERILNSYDFRFLRNRFLWETVDFQHWDNARLIFFIRYISEFHLNGRMKPCQFFGHVIYWPFTKRFVDFPWFLIHCILRSNYSNFKWVFDHDCPISYLSWNCYDFS